MTRASRWVLAAGIAGSALAVGTVHTITLCIVTAALAVAAVLAWWGAEPMKARSAATLLLFTGIGLTAYTALQCVPMPIGWLAVIAPHNADVWSRALAPLHEPGPSWVPISLDPTATRVEVLKGVAYLLAFVTALRVARNRDGVRFLSAVVVVTALALALAAVLHPAFGAKRLFGLYEPEGSIAGRHLAPLLNANNLAGYINLALCLSLASLLAPEPHVPRPIAGAVVVLLVAAQVWVASRGGVVTMVLGALIVVVIARITRTRHSGTVPRIALVTGAALIAGTAIFVLSGSDEASSELLDTDVSKLKMFAATVRGLPAMPFFGCGRGAFESVFPAFRLESGYVTYTHPENVVAQWIVEWGLPVGIAGLAAMAFALRPNVVLARSTTAGGAWAGLVALVVQNLGDLGTEVPGLVLAGVVCAAIVAAGTPGHESKRFVERWSRHPRRVALGAGACAVAALLLGAGVLGGELHDDRDALYQATLNQTASTRVMHAMARAAMLRHPAEPYLPFMAALRAARERDDDPIPWLGATLERARVYGPAHLLLARVVVARSPSQARLEYRLAMEQAPNLVGNVMAEAPRVVGGYFDAMELVPVGKEGTVVSELLVQAIKDRLPATRVLLDAELMERVRTARGPVSRSASDAVEDLEATDGAPWCQGAAREPCVREALAKARQLEQMAPDLCEGYVLHARARVASGDVAGGITALEKATDEVTDRLWCLKELVAIARRTGSDTHTEAALEKILAVGCGDEAACAENLRWVGLQYESMGKSHKALALYRRAFERAPDDALLAHMADLAVQGGLHAEAAADYEQLARSHPENAQWRRLAVTEHDAAMREAVRL
jgi:tetratricopeptide (TPR) repeat protein